METKYLELIFNPALDMLKTEGDRMLLKEIQEEVAKRSLAEGIGEFVDGCWIALDGYICINVDEFLDSEHEYLSFDELYDTFEQWHINGELISRELWYSEIYDVLKDGAMIIQDRILGQGRYFTPEAPETPKYS